MSKSNFFKKVDHVKEKLRDKLEKIGFTKEQPPREVLQPRQTWQTLQHWQAIRKNGIINQGDLQNIYNNYDPAKGTPWMCLVHMARNISTKDKGSAERIKVLRNNFENQIRTWDILSTSLLSNKAWENEKKKPRLV